MKVKYALEPLEKSIFLAGPTPRDKDTPSWRPQALELLKGLNFDGTVYVPEKEDWAPHSEYDHQVFWEWEALNQSGVIVFWVPRDLQSLPGFTTNVEFGLFAGTSKLVLGYPENAAKMRYLDRLAQRYHIPVYRTLEETLEQAVAMTKEPFGRPKDFDSRIISF